VLIVEDNVINALLIKSILNKNNIKCEMVSNGKSAIEKIRNNNFDLILMDIQMPEMNGVECTKIMRNEGIKAKIFALTGYSQPDEIKTFIDSGMDDVIIKPFSEKTFLSKIYET
jgi:CheY-like chemotaxis protein